MRCVALVEEPHLRLLTGVESIYELAGIAVANRKAFAHIDLQKVSASSGWTTTPFTPATPNGGCCRPMDHPSEPARCLVSGTGLTHLGSAKNRQAMHSAGEAELNDSMKMFQWGVEGGKPAPGKIGIAPEWFYKGSGTILRAHDEPLDVPAFAEDGGEEAEIAGVYFVGADGTPRRIGMAHWATNFPTTSLRRRIT